MKLEVGENTNPCEEVVAVLPFTLAKPISVPLGIGPLAALKVAVVGVLLDEKLGCAGSSNPVHVVKSVKCEDACADAPANTRHAMPRNKCVIAIMGIRFIGRVLDFGSGRQGETHQGIRSKACKNQHAAHAAGAVLW